MVDQSYSESVNKSLITYTVQSKSAFNLVVACESSLNIFLVMFIIQTMQLWIPDELSTSSAFSIQLAKVRILSDIFDLSTTNALSFVRSSENTFRVLSDVVFFSAVEEGQFTSLKWQHLNLQLLWNHGRPSLQFSSYQSRKKCVKISCIRVLQRHTRLEGVWPPVIRIGHHWVQYHYYTDEVW